MQGRPRTHNMRYKDARYLYMQRSRFMARTLYKEGARHDPDQERLGASFVRQDVGGHCRTIPHTDRKMNDKKILIRHARPNDLTAIQELFVDTIEAVCRYDYSPEQIAVWTSSIENTKRWTDKLMKQYFLIAEIDNRIVGFASLENNEYFDFMYVHKDYQRQGIADNLYSEIEAKAIKHGATLLTSDVSITARPFFEKKGFKIMAEQRNDIKCVEVINYKMIKELRIEKTTNR